MAKGETVYRFRIALSDVDRGVYETLEFRVARHSSETEEYLLTRVLAFALNAGEGLEFSAGLCVPEEPAIRRRALDGTLLEWIDIGNPSARRLHKAAKAARSVRVYTYKDPENLKAEVAGEGVHRAEAIEVFAFSPKFLATLAEGLARDNDWALVHDGGELMVTQGEETLSGRLESHRLAD
jgi:uncharacterized protein YaeQ